MVQGLVHFKRTISIRCTSIMNFPLPIHVIKTIDFRMHQRKKIPLQHYPTHPTPPHPTPSNLSFRMAGCVSISVADPEGVFQPMIWQNIF